MKKVILLTLIIFSFISADELISDSLKYLPPRLRGISDPEYFNAFIKPRTRDSLNMRLVGRWPFGPGFEVYGDSARQIVCYGGGSGVLLFDISTPDNPIRLSQICADGLINQLLIKDSLLFIASNGLEIYNIIDPMNPVRIGTAMVPVRDFCLKDTFTFCVAGDSLRILNIADPSNSFQIAALNDSGVVIGLSGSYAYSAGRWQLSVIDISNPFNPHVDNSLPVYIHAMIIDGTQLYANNDNSGFTIYNISNPLNIWQESAISGLGGWDFYKLGDYVYSPDFHIIDVSDSANPAVVGDTILSATAWAVWVNNNFGYAYVANSYEGLRLININNPTNPIPGNAYYGADNSRDGFIQGNYAYVANMRKGLKIVDVSIPSNPFEVGEYDTVGIQPNLNSIWVRDSFAYVPTTMTTAPGALKILNIQEPSNPVLITTSPVATGNAEDIFIKDSFAYLISGIRMYQEVKIKNPFAPESLRRYMLPDGGTPWKVFVNDSFAYVADGDSGLRILNIKNPGAPYEIGHFDAPDAIYSVFIKDTLAYLAALSAGLRFVNIKNPASPQEIGYYITPGWTRDVWVVDTIAYVAASGCVEVINIINPITPFRIAYYDGLPQSPRRIFYKSPYLYYAAFESGVGIFQWDEVGINEGDKISNNLLFSVNPTIANKYLYIELTNIYNKTDLNINVYDRLGRIVMQKSIINNIDLNRYKINVNNLPTGVYFVGIDQIKKKTLKKIVVVH